AQRPHDSTAVVGRQTQVVEKLLVALRYMQPIHWRQSPPEALELYKTTKDPKLKRFLMSNGSRYDLIDENKPFVGTEPMPPGRNLYPKGLTRAQIEDYVKKHPEQKDAIYSPYTVVRRDGDKLKTIPYHVEYKQRLEHAV